MILRFSILFAGVFVLLMGMRGETAGRAAPRVVGPGGGASSSKLDASPAPYHVAPGRIPRPVRKATARYLLILSIDGLAYATLQRFLPRLPTLRCLARRGFRRPLVTVFPSMTWVAHVSAATGQYPRIHGIIGNRWIQSGKGLVRPYLAETSDLIRRARTPSLYDLADAKEWPTAALNWSATQFATTLTYNLPETMSSAKLPARLTSRPLAKLLYHLRPTLSPHHARRGRPWGRRWPYHLGRIMKREDLRTDRLVTDIALRLLRLPRAKIPRLLMMHFVAADSVQHRQGTSAAGLFPVIHSNDRMLTEVLQAYRRAGLEKQLAVLVMSDHGFCNIHRTMDLRLLLYRGGFARYRHDVNTSVMQDARVRVVFNGHAAFVYVKDDDPKVVAQIARRVRRRAYRACVKAVFGPKQYASLGLPRPVALASEDHETRAEISSGRYYHPGAPSLIVLSRPHCGFYSGHRHAILRRVRWRTYGMHGYLPTLRSLHAFLIGAGAGIVSSGRELPPRRIVDVAPTGARLLGLAWPKHFPSSPETFRLDGRTLVDALGGTAK